MITVQEAGSFPRPSAHLVPPALDDPAAFACVPRVPIVDTHPEETAVNQKGERVVLRRAVDLARLKLLARNGNDRAKRGDLAILTIGHTHDEPEEETQPKPVGYARNFQIGEYAGKPVLLADLCVERAYAQVAGTYPRRSAEIWAGDQPEDHFVDVVALLRRAPRRDLGLVTRYARGGPAERHTLDLRALDRYAAKRSPSPGQMGFGFGDGGGGDCGAGKAGNPGFQLGNTCRGGGQSAFAFGQPEESEDSGDGPDEFEREHGQFWTAAQKAMQRLGGGGTLPRILEAMPLRLTGNGSYIRRLLNEAVKSGRLDVEHQKDGELLYLQKNARASGSDLDKEEDAFRKAQRRPLPGQTSFLARRRSPGLSVDRLCRALGELGPRREDLRRAALGRVLARYDYNQGGVLSPARSNCGAGRPGSPGFQQRNTCGARRGGGQPAAQAAGSAPATKPSPGTYPLVPRQEAPAKASTPAARPVPDHRKALISDLQGIASKFDESDPRQRRAMAREFGQRLDRGLQDQEAIELAGKLLPASIAGRVRTKADAIAAIQHGLNNWSAPRAPRGKVEAATGQVSTATSAPAWTATASPSGGPGQSISTADAPRTGLEPTPTPTEKKPADAKTPGKVPTPRPPTMAKAREAQKVRQAQARQSAVKQATGQDPATHTNHAPGTVTMLRSDLIGFDPERFQYKLGGSHTTGSVGSLSGVKKWDPELAGVIQVWKDPADDKTYVVNGHNRMDLAKKLGVRDVAVRFLQADNADQAMAKGALTNIAEGRGTAIDAAKFFKKQGVDRSFLEEKGIPLREKVATNGLAMANLPDELLNRVVTGDLTEEQGAAIGGGGLEPEQQMAIANRVQERQPTLAQLKEYVNLARMAGSRSQQGDLFGAGEDQAMFEHRADLQAFIKGKLSKEKNIFRGAANAAAAELLSKVGNQIQRDETAKAGDEAALAHHLFSKLTSRAGSSAGRLMNRFAERMAEAKTRRDRNEILSEAYQAVRDEVPNWMIEFEDFGMAGQDDATPERPSGPSMFDA